MKKLSSATVRPAFRVVPKPGYHMVSFGNGEYLVVNDADRSNNVIIGADTVAGLLADLASGGPMDEFQFGMGTMWKIEQPWD